MFRAQLRRKESGGGEKEVVGHGDDRHLARRAAAKHSGGGGQGGVEGEEGGIEEELGGHHGEGGGGGQCHHPSLDWSKLNRDCGKVYQLWSTHTHISFPLNPQSPRVHESVWFLVILLSCKYLTSRVSSVAVKISQ